MRESMAMSWKMIVKRSMMLLKTAGGPSEEEFGRIVKITMILSLSLGALGIITHFILGIV